MIVLLILGLVLIFDDDSDNNTLGWIFLALYFIWS